MRTRRYQSLASFTADGMAALPPEVWLLIVRSFVPPNDLFALPATHEITKALINLCLTSKQLRDFAQPQLFRHCAYIDTDWRLAKGLRTLDDAPRDVVSEKLYLAPFLDDDETQNPAIATSAAALLTRIRHSLRSLVLDAVSDPTGPFHDKHEIAKHELLLALRELKCLEDFICISVFLFWTRPQVMQEKLAMWSCWPKLQRFALCCASIEEPSDIDALLELPSLKQLTLSRCAIMFPERFLTGPTALNVHIVDIRPPFMPDASKEAFEDARNRQVPKISFTNLSVTERRRGYEIMSWLRSLALDQSLWTCEATGY